MEGLQVAELDLRREGKDFGKGRWAGQVSETGRWAWEWPGAGGEWSLAFLRGEGW